MTFPSRIGDGNFKWFGLSAFILILIVPISFLFVRNPYEFLFVEGAIIFAVIFMINAFVLFHLCVHELPFLSYLRKYKEAKA